MLWYSLVAFIPMLLFSSLLNVFSDLNPSIYSPNSSPHGIPYANWIAEWWKWWLGTPTGEHPGEGTYTPSKCTLHQHGPVWFMPDITGDTNPNVVRACTIPVGKSILLPLSMGESDKTDPCTSRLDLGPDLDSRIRDCATKNRESVIFNEITVDGVNILNFKELYRATTDFFNVTIPKNPTIIFGPLEPGTYKAMADGYLLFLKPFSVGNHIVKYDLNEKLRDSPHINHRNVTYLITIK
jgi:hypothetical protein